MQQLLTLTETSVYQGSLEEMRGGRVLWAGLCHCGKCAFAQLPRLELKVRDPHGREVFVLEHARPESVSA